MQLLFDVKRNVLSRKDKYILVANSKNYISAKFNFSDDWIGKVKTVIFSREEQSYPMLLDEYGVCQIPNEIMSEAGGFRVSVGGVGDNVSIPSTNSFIVHVHAGFGLMESQKVESLSLLEQILNRLAQLQESFIDYETIAKCVKEYLAENLIETDVSAEAITKITQEYIEAHKSELKGADGKTPIRGKDYWTKEDIKSVHDYINQYIDSHRDDYKGNDGKSAYDIAVENGFLGSESDWLESLKGKDGIPGESSGSSTLSDSIHTTVAVGGIEAGTSYEAGTSVEKILRELLNPVLNPSLTGPSATLSTDRSRLIESGSTVNTRMVISFNRGSIIPPYGTSGNRAGKANGFSLNGSSVQEENTFNVTVSETNTSYQGEVNYLEGEQPKNSAGEKYNAPLSPGTIKTNILVFEFVDALYANISEIKNVNKLPLISKSAKSKQFDFPAQTKEYPEEFHVPASWQISAVQVLNPLNNKWEDCSDEFTRSEVNHANASGKTIEYIKYIDNRGYNAGPRSIKITWK